jgi:hypothetical protein
MAGQRATGEVGTAGFDAAIDGRVNIDSHDVFL